MKTDVKKQNLVQKCAEQHCLQWTKAKLSQCPSVDVWLNKMWYKPILNIVAGQQKEWNTGTDHNMDKLQSIMLNKYSDTKYHILHDFIYLKYPE